MTRRLASVLAFAALVGLLVTLGCQPAPETPAVATTPAVADDAAPPVAVPAEDLKALVEANNAFAIDLYKKIAETETGNIFFSPYSIHAALSMTYAGARGETAAQMAKVLGIEKLGNRVHPAHAELARKLKSSGERGTPEFNVANALWGQKGLEFRSEFVSLIKRGYSGGVRELDFAGDTEGSRKTINKWVSDETREKISELLTPGAVSSDACLVLANAIFYKGVWAAPFVKEETKDAPFQVNPTEKVVVPMMRTRPGNYKYSSSNDCDWVQMPYADNRFAMLLIVPNSGRLEQLEATLKSTMILEGLTNLKYRHGTVSLPKFQLNARLPLNSMLMAMGMTQSFSAKADFTGILGTRGLSISKVVHQAVLEVDETGTVAAAATAVRIDVSYRIQNDVCIDRPFLLYIYNTQTGNIFFSGRVCRPASIR